MINDQKSLVNEKEYSIWTYMSYNMVAIFLSVVAAPIGAYYHYFYTVAVGLNPAWIAGAYAFYAIWDAVNDPLMGHISDKPRKWTKRWGRRFPWIVLAGIPLLIVSFLIWTPPMGTNMVANIIYFIGIMTLFELFYTMAGAPYSALFIEKFRTEKDRRRNSAVGVFAGLIAVILGLLLPGMILGEETSDPNQYRLMSLVITIPALFFFVLGIPGIREKRKSVENTLQVLEQQERPSFFKSFITALKNKNFVVFGIAAFFEQVGFGLVITMLIYWLQFVIGVSDIGTNVGILYLIFFISGTASAPLWALLGKKTGNKIGYAIVLISLTLALTLLFFANTLPVAIILIALLGVCDGGGKFVGRLLLADCMDELTVTTGAPNQGFFTGIYQFIMRANALIPPIIIAIVYGLTNFDAENITSAAVGGIKALMSWIPAIWMGISALLLLFVYNLTPGRTSAIKEKLREMNL